MRTPKRVERASGAVVWRVTFRVDRGGKDTSTSETFPTKREAENFCTLLEALGPQGALDHLYAEQQKAAVPTLDEYAELVHAALPNITEATRRKYRRIYAASWSPILGGQQLHTITRQQVSTALNQVAATGKADKTIANEWGVLATIFKEAVIDGEHITQTPCRGIRPTRRTEHEREEMVILDADDARRLIAEIQDHYKPLVLALLDTGMRWGEAAALRVGDVNLRQETIKIVRAVKDGGEIGPPKTPRSRRTIYVNAMVREWVEPLMSGRGKGELLFTAPRGGMIRHRTFWSDIWRPAVWRAQHCPDHFDEECRCGTAHPKRCKVHRVPPEPCGCEDTLTVEPRIHDLRHTHASNLLADGMPIHLVSERLGHQSIETTADTYGHLLPDVKKMAARVGALSGLRAGTPEAPAIDS